MKRLKPIVLAAEDDPEFRKALELVLSRFGLNVVGVSTTEDFLKNVDKLKPDLYLIDLQLGAQSGFDLIENLRKKLGITEPILVVSGGRKPEMIAHALELGANDYIMKPLDRTFLAAKLSRYLDAEHLVEHRPIFLDLPVGRSAARIEFRGKILEVDELGVRLSTTSLIPKGSVLKLKCDLLRDAGVPEGEALVAVASTELDAESKRYQIYAEFDGVDVEFMQSIRRWLTRGNL
jgi:DNA-binding response OmpR family regulator